MISIHCPACTKSLTIPEALAGSNVTRPQCQAVCRVPAAGHSETTPPARSSKRVVIAVLVLVGVAAVVSVGRVYLTPKATEKAARSGASSTVEGRPSPQAAAHAPTATLARGYRPVGVPQQAPPAIASGAGMAAPNAAPAATQWAEPIVTPPATEPYRTAYSGAAFVVNSDGYLLTARHVIAGATKLNITLGNVQYEATVAASDDERDVAILKIDAKGLPVVPLEAEAAGPGTAVTIFGTGLTASKAEELGSRQGVVKAAHAGSIVVDCPLNPGFAGGPLVTVRGNAIGVASGKLSGADLRHGGRAIPVEQAVALLRREGVAFTSSLPAGPFDAGVLWQRMTPAVAQVTTVTPESDPQAWALRSGRASAGARLASARASRVDFRFPRRPDYRPGCHAAPAAHRASRRPRPDAQDPFRTPGIRGCHRVQLRQFDARLRLPLGRGDARCEIRHAAQEPAGWCRQPVHGPHYRTGRLLHKRQACRCAFRGAS